MARNAGVVGARAAKRLAMLQAAVKEFNARYPVGAEVVYSPVLGSGQGLKRTVIVDPAYVLGGHTAVCFVSRVRGCVSCGHVVGRQEFEAACLGQGSVAWAEDFEHCWRWGGE